MIELKELKDRQYLINFLVNDPDVDKDYEQIKREFFQEGHFVFGYEVFKDGIRRGVAFALMYDGLYTLDGYNEGSYIYGAVVAGKAVIEKLFDKYTDVVYTEHNVNKKNVTLLAEKIGFIQMSVYGDRNVMVLEKEMYNGWRA